MEDDDKYTRITLRIPKDVHKRLAEAADQTSKSLNAEIVARLQQSFDLGPLKEAKRDELLRLVNEAIDARLEFEQQRAAAAPAKSSSKPGATKKRKVQEDLAKKLSQ
jgi:hypothetical protein